MKNLLVVVSVLVITSSVSAVIISADADGYTEGTNISTAFAGLTLSSIGSSFGLDGIVYAYDDELASTGTSVFGHNLSNHKEWYVDHYPEPHHPDDFAFRADFDNPAKMVAIDMICNSSFAYAMLMAYDSSGVVLGGVASPAYPHLTYGEVFRATINRDSFDIAYVIVGGSFTNWATPVLIDNLTANVIPEPATYFVDALNGDDDNDGLSPETAFATIQKGIDSADDGDTVIVAPGTYTGEGNRDIDFLGKAITVQSIDPNDPNIVATTIIDCNGSRDEPHRGFYFHNNEDGNSVVKGLSITNGHYFYYYGGSGIHCENSSPTITNCIISDNVSWGRGGGGGAISIFQSICLINNCTISGNSGRGMENSGSSPTLTNCTFSGNSDCGMWNNESSPTLTDCTFSNNSAGSGGGMFNLDQSNPTLTNCTFSENSAEIGGGMCNSDSNPTLTNCTFSGNSATGVGVEEWGEGYGGGMLNYESNPTLTNCTFSGNSATEGGGGMANWESNNLTLTNCTFAGNSALNGNALSCNSWRYPNNFQITNCILWDGGDEIWNNDGSTITITYSDVQGSWPGEGNIDADPCFVEPGYWDTDSVWVKGDYHLLPVSPCIDAANDANVYTDIEGNIRPFDFPGVDNNGELPEFDMGAYEAMVSCFGVNHVKLETKAGKKGNKVELKGTFSPALPIDFARDDVIYIIDDGQGHMLSFVIPAGSFEPEGKPEKQRFKFDSPKHSQPDIRAKFDFLKCKFELKVKGVMDTSEISGDSLAIVLQAGENPANLVEEVVQVEAEPKRLEYKREPKLSCCPKCRGIALLEVTSTDTFTGDEYVLVFEPDPGKEKLKRKTVVDDGVNGRVKIDTSCSKPLEVGDVFGAYTVTDLIKIFDDWPDDDNDE